MNQHAEILRTVTYNGKSYPITLKLVAEKHELDPTIHVIRGTLPYGRYPKSSPMREAIRKSTEERLFTAMDEESWGYIEITYWHPSYEHAEHEWTMKRFTTPPATDDAKIVYLHYFYNNPVHPAVRKHFAPEALKDPTQEPMQFRGLGTVMLCKTLQWLVEYTKVSPKDATLVLVASGGFPAREEELKSLQKYELLQEVAKSAPYALADYISWISEYNTERIKRLEKGNTDGDPAGKTDAETMSWDELLDLINYFNNNAPQHFASLFDNRGLVSFYKKVFGMEVWQGGKCNIVPNDVEGNACVTLYTLMGASLETVLSHCK